ncbi:hypothetical protein F4804DRAFT_351817 [Jackrogersella minutella]|nr:hypothetical protein F4804DRAFT_351817 [Jackrogersella minutella]
MDNDNEAISLYWAPRKKRSHLVPAFVRNVKRRFWFFVLVVLLTLIFILMNTPYRLADSGLSHSTGASSSLDVSVSLPGDTWAKTANSTELSQATEANVNAAQDLETPAKPAATGTSTAAPPDSEYCTTWPVDSDGKYTPEPKPAKALSLDSFAPEGGWKKPNGLKVVAVVFYGRKRNVDILDCYLQQNMVSNGGYVDEVRYLVRTDKEDDVNWLKDFVEGKPKHNIVDLGDCTQTLHGCIWEHGIEIDTMFLKIDSDITYIHHDAVPQLVHTRLAQPHPLVISAQVINSPATGIQHGAIHPFLPDPSPRPTRPASASWRPSSLGPYPADAPGNPADLQPPYRGHPWLLALQAPPIGASPGRAAAAAAQQQYSLLYNLERNQMALYHFGRRLSFPSDQCNSYRGPGGEQLYDEQRERHEPKFAAVWGHDFAAVLPADDEAAMPPQRPDRPSVVDTRAVAAYLPQEVGRQTDLLDRWRAFANENVCSADNQKSPWDGRCEGF